ncbi:MAG: YihY/virulence factor BrkB family protein [Sphingomicrobium sp.]
MENNRPASSADRNVGPATGRSADTPAQIPVKGWRQVALRTWKQSSEDNIGLVAAGVAFYGFLALVPLLGATVLTYGLVAAPETVLGNVRSLAAVMPADAAKLIGEQLMSVVQTSGSKKGFGLILALAITAGAVVLAIVAMIAVAALGHLEKMFPHLPGALLLLGKLGSYALLLAGAAAGAASLYRYGPYRKKARWAWITPGSIFASVGWILLTLGFGFYAANFGNYGKTYGSLATVVVLLTWMYLSAYVLLFGAELNSELEHQTAKDTTAGAAKPIGQRGAWSADHVASSDAAEKPSGGDVSPPTEKPPAEPPSVPAEHSYLTSRVAARAGKLAGGAKVGMLGSVMATLGLSLLRRKGRAGAGAALLGTAAGLALLRRKDD